MFTVSPMKMNKPMKRALSEGRAYRGIQLGNETISKGLVKDTKEGIRNPPKDGRMYTINGRAHQASAAGQYPATVTGKLMNSINDQHNKLEFEFGSEGNLKYAPILQQFADSSIRTSSFKKLAPRPYLTLSHDKQRPFFIKNMVTSFRKVTGF